MMAPLFVVALAVAADADAAAKLEADAFAAVDSERWCSAMTLFLEANRQAPAGDLVYNAARAADLAGDFDRARVLYAEVAGAHRDEAVQRMTALANVTSSSTCSATAERGPRVITASTSSATPSASTSSASTSSAPTSAGTSSATTAPPLSFKHVARSASNGGGGNGNGATRASASAAKGAKGAKGATPGKQQSSDVANVPWDWVALGGGSALLATSAAMVAVGAEPWVTANSAAGGDARQDGVTRFDNYGKGAVVAGGALMATSLAILAGGAVLHEE